MSGIMILVLSIVLVFNLLIGFYATSKGKSGIIWFFYLW